MVTIYRSFIGTLCFTNVYNICNEGGRSQNDTVQSATDTRELRRDAFGRGMIYWATGSEMISEYGLRSWVGIEILFSPYSHGSYL